MSDNYYWVYMYGEWQLALKTLYNKQKAFHTVNNAFIVLERELEIPAQRVDPPAEPLKDGYYWATLTFRSFPEEICRHINGKVWFFGDSVHYPVKDVKFGDFISPFKV